MYFYIQDISSSLSF